MRRLIGTFASAARTGIAVTIGAGRREGPDMRAQVVGRTLEWWCEADGAAMALDADEPILGPATLRFVETHSAHDGVFDFRRTAAEPAGGP